MLARFFASTQIVATGCRFMHNRLTCHPCKSNQHSPKPSPPLTVLPDNFSCDQCSKWTGTHRNGVPVREMDRCNRSVSSKYVRTHQNAVPVRHFSIIITFSTLKSVAD